MPNILGDIDKSADSGHRHLHVERPGYRLEPFAEPGDQQFWFVFRDLTSQKETYPAARFLYAPRP